MPRGSDARSASSRPKRARGVIDLEGVDADSRDRSRRRQRLKRTSGASDKGAENDDSISNRGLYGAVQKTPNIYQDFRPGNLLFLRMKNFLTFSDTVLRPGPRLNLILGPNGTGKSSIVNAVCIAFGGKLGLLGRATELGAFVRHGMESAEVEVWVHEPEAREGFRCVKRKFDNEGRSEYFLDDSRVRREDIEVLNKRYDIQLDNLSQFMPQEKIAEFVNLKPEDLLHNTVRALGGTERLDEYYGLITFDARFVADQSNLEKKQNKVNELVAKNKSIEAEVDAFHELQRLKEAIGSMKRYLPWTYHQEAQQAFIAAKEQCKNKEAEVVTKREEVGLLRGPLTAIEERRKALWDDFQDAKRVVGQKDRIVAEGTRNVDNMLQDMQKIVDDIQAVENTIKRRDREIDRIKQHLDEEQARIRSLSAHSDENQDKAAVDEACRQRASLQADRRNLDNRRSELQELERGVSREIHRLNSRLQSLSDARSLRIAELEKNFQNRGLAACAQWISNNKHKFRGPVYGPIAAEVACSNDYHARVLKSAIAPWAWAAFVVESTIDQDTLRREVPSALGGIKPNVFTTPLDENGQYDLHVPFFPDRSVDDRLLSLGINAALTDIFAAPDTVKAALNAQFQFHRMHVGTELADRHLEELQHERGVGVWYTPSSRCQVCRSRYDSSAVSTSVDDLPQDPGVFAGRINEVERERDNILQRIRCEEDKLQVLQEQFRATENGRRELLEGEETLGRSIVEARNRISSRSRLSQSIANCKRRMESIRSAKTTNDAELQRQKLRSQLAEKQAAFPSQIQEIQRRLTFGVRALAVLDEATCKLSAAERELKTELRRHAENSSELQEMEKQWAELKSKVSEERRNVRKCQADAERSLPHEEYLQNVDYYQQFPCSASELQEQIDATSEQCRHMTNGGYAVVEEYERNKALIEEMEVNIETLQRKLDRTRQSFDAEKVSFLSWLESCIQRMRRRFSELFMRLGCRGDIELINSSSDRMADLAIQILVSYREDVDLRPISAAGNSGGEKMACTMLYCFSLQEQEKSPAFVMVDELNQGLDPDNERYIMKVMLEDAERGSAPQSFVVTPKLLLNLPVYTNTATHIIMNGAVALPVLDPQRR